MKTLLFILIIGAIFASCSSDPRMGSNVSLPGGTVIVADTTGLAEFQSWKAQNVADKAVTNNTRRSSTAITTSNKRSVSSVPSTVQTIPVTKPQKKGWSKAAKGAAIGAGSGAVIGAVIHKRNRVVGGVVGGIIGGGVGYGIGRTMDKRDGR